MRASVEPASLPGVHELLAGLWTADPGVSPEDRMWFTTAVAEVATNIIKHGQPRTGSEMIVTLRMDAERLEALFSDDGIAVATMVSDVCVADGMAESGRGLDIARATLDELTYQRVGDCNRWHLIRRRSPTETEG